MLGQEEMMNSWRMSVGNAVIIRHRSVGFRLVFIRELWTQGVMSLDTRSFVCMLAESLYHYMVAKTNVEVKFLCIAFRWQVPYLCYSYFCLYIQSSFWWLGGWVQMDTHISIRFCSRAERIKKIIIIIKRKKRWEDIKKKSHPLHLNWKAEYPILPRKKKKTNGIIE